MFKVDKFDNISFDQGDTGNIKIDLVEHRLIQGDKICLTVYTEAGSVLIKDITTFEDGNAFIIFRHDDTKDLPIGRYKYSIRVFIPSKNYVSTLIKDKEFIIERSYLCNA